jgi:hypothetical protein
MDATLSSLDVVIQRRSDSTSFTLRALFDALATVGIAYSPSGDRSLVQAYADLIVAAVGSLSDSPTEEGVRPLRSMAVDEAMYARVDPRDPSLNDGTIGAEGTFIQVAADMARMGMGRLRRVKQCDIYWACLFPYSPTSSSLFQNGTQVRRPGDILDAMRSDAYGRLAWATLMIVTCYALDLKLDLTPFNAGGGGVAHALRATCPPMLMGTRSCEDAERA